MTIMTAVFKKSIEARLLCIESMFINKISVSSFDDLQKVLGGVDDCYVVKLPLDILLWCSVPKNINEYEHTVTIRDADEREEYIYGNVIITSNDEDNLMGMNDLTEQQFSWLRENFRLEESKEHRGHIFAINSGN